MLRFLVKRAPIRHLARGMPIAGLLSAAQVAMLAGRHLAKLNPGERRRLVRLLGKRRGGSGSWSAAEREELGALVAKLEPRLFAGLAARQVR